jgi:hypothetical protein
MMDYNVLPPDPDSGYKYSKANAERHAELVRSGRATDGPAGALLELLWGLIRLIFSGLTRLWRQRS